MNFLDIILIIINVILFIIGIITIILAIIDWNTPWSDAKFYCGMYWLFYVFVGVFFILGFVVVDKSSGTTVGIVTSVDKNFFGTTALYIKTSENEQEKYCIENEEVAEVAKNLIGKNVKISYGERVGFYSTGKCHQAPVESIKIQELNKD